jgi:DNA-binding MurR/RpiR family transcriptional regulator
MEVRNSVGGCFATVTFGTAEGDDIGKAAAMESFGGGEVCLEHVAAAGDGKTDGTNTIGHGAIGAVICCVCNTKLYRCRMHVRETLQARLGTMRRSEAEVARRLLRDLGLVAERSLREVAAELGTSDATVMRACRAAGFDGFQDLKYHVLRELTAGGGGRDVVVDDAYGSDIAASLAAAAPVLERAAGLLRGARRVALVGVGASQGVALIATDVLFTLGKQAMTLPSEQGAAFAFASPVDGLVLLAISHSGETQLPVRVVMEAREAGIPSIGLTNEPASELAKVVDVLVPTQAVESPRGSYAIGPRICQLAVLEALLRRVCGEGQSLAEGRRIARAAGGGAP